MIAGKVPPSAGVDPGGSEGSLAYSPEDGSFALFNDYANGRAVLRRGAEASVPAEPRSTWHRPRDPAAARPAGPIESVEGYGIFTFPYGPVSMGVPESGKFEVRTYGERILSLVPVAGYKSRQILTSIVGRPVPDAALRIERLAGNFSAAHASAFLAAAESATGLEVAREELWIRALAQELQRLYNHVHVLARLAEAASQNVGSAQSHALAEEILRLQGSVFGHRWLFGALLPGGPRRHLDATGRQSLAQELGRHSEHFERLWELFLGSRTFIDRIQGTCTVRREDALRWGAVGPTLRACGIAWDDRLRAPTAPYTDLFLELPQESAGDALARLMVRAGEVRSSYVLLEQLLDRWPRDPTGRAPPADPVVPGRGLARVESPSGDLVYDVTVVEGKIAHVGMRSASQANIPLFARGLRNGVFTDFHFAWESFGLVFAEIDA